MPRCRTDILMYHSISPDPGPTSISQGVFASQMQAIASARVPVISMDEVAARFQGSGDADYAIAITFDDGFEDFATVAWPVLNSHGFSPMVYLPGDLVGETENWMGCQSPPRKLMNWETIIELSKAGVQFGSHTNTHPDLTKLIPDKLADEISTSQKTIEHHLGQPIQHFAPPYGYSNPNVRDQISRHYQTSVGTILGTASSQSDILNLPRLEMHYFVDAKRWENHLSGTGAAYLKRRKTLRKIRQLAQFGR